MDLAGNVKNKINWAPRLGVTYQLNPKTVVRAGYGRSYDIGVFGSTFGHSVTQNLPVLSFQAAEPAQQLRQRVQPGHRARRRRSSPAVPANGRFPLPNGVSARALPETQNLSHVDAYNVTVQRELSLDGLRGDRLRRQPRPGLLRRQPRRRRQRADDRRATRTCPRDQRRPFFATLRLDAGHRLLQQHRQEPLQLDAGQAHQALLRGYSLLTHYTLQSHKNNDGEYVFIDPDVNYGRGELRPQARVRPGRAARSCPTARADVRDGCQRGRGRHPRRLAVQRHRHRHERPAVQRRATATPARTATPAPAGPTSSATRPPAAATG